MGALLPSLYFGQAVVGTLGLFSPTRAFEIMERYQVTNTLLYPTALEQAMQEVPQPGERYKLALRAMAVTEKNMDQSTFERSEEHTSELQSLMRISYAVFCLKKKKQKKP